MLKDTPWKKSYKARQCIEKQRHYFADKSPFSQGYGFSSSHVWMWELDHKESWVPKNWCFWTVLLEKTLESPLDAKEIKPVHPKGNQFWIFTGRTDTKAEALILWPLMWRTDSLEKTQMLGKTEGGRRRGRQRMRWLDGITEQMDVELKQAPGVGDGQQSLECCSSWVGQKVGYNGVTELKHASVHTWFYLTDPP